jgi:hypothetical protein
MVWSRHVNVLRSSGSASAAGRSAPDLRPVHGVQPQSVCVTVQPSAGVAHRMTPGCCRNRGDQRAPAAHTTPIRCCGGAVARAIAAEPPSREVVRAVEPIRRLHISL